MMLPYASGKAASSGAGLIGLPLPWSAAPSAELPHLGHHLGLSPSSNATSPTSLLAMPPLPPGPPPLPPLPPALPVSAHQAPSMAAPLGAKPPPVYGDYADELACFAMKCHVAGIPEDERKPDLFCQSSVWEPLRCNEITGKVEVPFSADSPVEPYLGKMGRQVSYPTQVVRRAISFVFDDGPNSPVNIRRNTATAA